MIKFLLDFFPIVLFFITYKTFDLFAATIVIIASSLIQMLALRILKYKIEFMHWFSILLIVVMGGITIATKSSSFIMYKVSVLNIVFALLLLYSQFFMKQNFMEMILNKKIELTKPDWNFLNQMWVAFFILTAGINYFFALQAIKAKNALLNLDNSINELEIKALHCSDLSTNLIDVCFLAQNTEKIWVNFKLYGVLGLTVGFIIIQSLWLAKKNSNLKI